jgi:hypothetical protein
VRRGAAVVATAVTVLLALTGCFGADVATLTERAQAEFDRLVAQASAVDTAVLRSLETEEPATESCVLDEESGSEGEHVVFVAAGTFSVGTTGPDEREVLSELGDGFDEELWTPMIVADGIEDQVGFADPDGVAAILSLQDALLVISVFTPCR